MTAHDLARDALAKALHMEVIACDDDRCGPLGPWGAYHEQHADAILAALAESEDWQAAIAEGLHEVGVLRLDDLGWADPAVRLARALGGRE